MDERIFTNLRLVSSPTANHQPASQTVLHDSPHSRDIPLLIHIGLQLLRLRWNFRKANWDIYTSTIEKSIVHIPLRSIAIEESYRRLLGANFEAASVSIPCLHEECQALLQQYEATGDARCKRWEKTTANLNFTHSSRKC